ncbi:GNAT family N-acetyltransferase [Bacillus sp. FJAT-49736]|uniref:GNAT family N-acetyltransferase n=1 Tax=Bacillus sp. FJAT-49736 TaxID=2833582 RepID=UPI001BCA3B73|nr:GNAT family N-acetyltransferase [Bacillus sp. FJAT-49736]MBS4172234.1 GNAT family N-acetyltransferase [Bacillus sp. FJAT-49736]
MMKLIKVLKEQKPVLHNLMQFYIYEFSKYIPEIKLEANGAYKPFDLDPYWENSDLHPFFIMLENEYIGFSLIESKKDGNPNTIKEFFIIQKYSGKGLGKRAAIQLFQMFPGSWKVTQIAKNYPAQAFWRSVISDISKGNYTEYYDENRRSVQKFII